MKHNGANMFASVDQLTMLKNTSTCTITIINDPCKELDVGYKLNILLFCVDKVQLDTTTSHVVLLV